MLTDFRRVISAQKFMSRRPAGQISSVLMIILVAILIFTLVTLNIGTVGLQATKLANATDASALQLGSSLATRANSLYHQMGDKVKVCVRGGLLGIVLAIIVAVVMVVAQQYYGVQITTAMVIGGAAVAGAIGNYVVYGTFQAALMGAVQGAMVGAAIATGGAMIGSGMGNTAATTAAGATSAAGEAIAAVQPFLNMLSVSGTGSIALGVSYAVLSSAAALYNASVQDKMKGAVMASLARYLNALPEYEQLRESIFQKALLMTVDDPTTVVDTEDIDGDNNYDERQPAFAYWWRQHLMDLRSSLVNVRSEVAELVGTRLMPFYDYMRGTYAPLFDRAEIECACAGGGESELLDLVRKLHGCGYTTTMGTGTDEYPWLPGPDNAALSAWQCNPAPTAPPAGFDVIDGVRYLSEDFMLFVRGLLQEKEQGGGGSASANCCTYYLYNVDALTNSLVAGPCEEQSDWLDQLYCPQAEQDYYGDLQDIRGATQLIIDGISAVRDELPGCQLKWGTYENKFMRYSEEGGFCQCLPSLPENLDPDSSIIDQSCSAVWPCYWTTQDNEACGDSTDICCLRQQCAAEEPECLEGVYLPNNPCKIDAAERDTLTDEVAVVREFVTNIEQHIIDEHFCGGNPCGDGEEAECAHCGLGAESDPNCPGSTRSVVISNVRDICLTGNIHPRCSRGSLEEGAAIIRYTYDWRAACSVCEEDCSTSTTTTVSDPATGITTTTSTDPVTGGTTTAVSDPATGMTTTTSTDPVTGVTTTSITPTPPPPITPPAPDPGSTTTTTTDPVTGVTTAVTTTTSCECQCDDVAHSGTETCEQEIAAADIDLNSVGTCNGAGACPVDKESFLSYLDRFDAALARVYEPVDCDPTTTGATIDEDWDDEFKPVISKLCGTLIRIDEFLPVLQAQADQINAALSGGGGGVSPAMNGQGTVAYDWVDSVGAHQVQVSTGPFVFSWVRKEKSGNFLVNKTCYIMTDFCNGWGCEPRSDLRLMTVSDVWVQIQRTDPGQRAVRSAGSVDLGLQWNPGSGARTITRRAWSHYGYAWVGIWRTRRD